MASGLPLLTAAITNPRFVVLRPKLLESSYVSYKDGRAVNVTEGEGVFSPYVKIEVEIAKKVEPGKTFVHLRFCDSNRYIGRREGSVIPVAESKQPDEDLEKTTSTLFELRNLYDSPDTYYFCYLQSGSFPQLNEARDELVIKEWRNTEQDLMYFELVDWDSLVKLPKYVAFKADNGYYLRGFWIGDYCYIQCGSGDPNHVVSRNEVELLPNGYVKIKCLHWSKYWRNGNCWIWADSDSSSTKDESLLFWPVKLDDNTIALRTPRNGPFCSRITADFKDDCLNACTFSITPEAKLTVQELVMERKITNVRYRMEDARIFNETPYIAGSAIGVNETDRETAVAVTLGRTISNTYSFSRSISLTAGVKVTIEAQVLEIVKASLELSIEVSTAMEWGESKTYEKSISATGTITVPPKSRAIVNYVGTRGTCEVPYSYRRQDKSSTDGKISFTDEIDGVYTGVNAYNFSFQVQKYEPL